MTLPASTLIAALRQGMLLPPEQIQEAARLTATHPTAAALAVELVKREWLTAYQGTELAEGRGLALVVGSYVLLAKLGEGGMGEVFRARHRVLGREDAVKRILPGRLNSRDAIERFLREARASAPVYPNVVPVYDAGEANGTHYLAMELVKGVNLASYLAQRCQLPVAEAVEYVRQACEGMQHAHERVLVHRDLKPGNLMLTEQRQVKILDLGLALVLDGATMTRAGGFFGTVDYVAPEQVTDSHKVDIRADVYSLGCTLYHLLAGKTPFDETHPAARPSMHLDQEPTTIEQRRADVPARVADVVRKMMAKQAGDRYQTPGEAGRALASLLKRSGSEPGRTRKPPPVPKKGTVPPPPPPPPPARTLDLTGQPGRLAQENTSTQIVSRPATGRRAQTRGRPVVVRLLIGGAALLMLGLVCLLFLLPDRAKEDKRKTDKDGISKSKDGTPVNPRGDPAQDDKGKAVSDKGPWPREITSSIGMKLVRIPPGKFLMGSPDDEKDRAENEGPVHEVEITKEFWLGVYEVTQGQYREVMGYNPSHFSHDGTKAPTGKYAFAQPRAGSKAVKDFTQIELDEFPVELVSWEDVQEFLAKLNARVAEKQQRREYRLPTEAEWEYACRAGADLKEPFSFAKPSASLSSTQANFNGGVPYGRGAIGPFLSRTCKVGSYQPNAFRLHDMHGNVQEWVSDWYGAAYYAASPRRDPRGPPEGPSSVGRGGYWLSYGLVARAACRRVLFRPNRGSDVGFRVVLVPSGK